MGCNGSAIQKRKVERMSNYKFKSRNLTEQELAELTESGIIQILAENGYTLTAKIGEDPFDPTEAGTKSIQPDDDFDDIELGEPQICTLEECTSCQ